ncbi:MAG: response regulator transcription factor [Clostridia bacterium]|nr:response regulator transcription factor [Clostridia bacterium]
MKILLVEDEVALSNAVKKLLEQKGYLVDAVYDGLSAVDYAEISPYDLLIVDIMLPGLDGIQVIERLRKSNLNTPVLMLTARTAISDKVTGLNVGADDYMTKPFHSEELLARVGALTRRKGEIVLNDVRFGDLSLNIESAILSRGDDSVQLSHKESEVLKVFLYNPTMTITTELLISRVWGDDSEATDNNVEVYISFIRKKLKYLKSNVSIKKLPKIGYRLEVNEA